MHTEETKTFKQKILEVLREEIGVEKGEEFDIYENGERQGTYKFEGNELFYEVDEAVNKFRSSWIWGDIICSFSSYTFKRKPFIPEYEEEYFFLSWKYGETNNIEFSVLRNIWVDNIVDYGMLALGNVFRSEEEAFGNKNKLAENLEKLRKGEQI